MMKSRTLVLFGCLMAVCLSGCFGPFSRKDKGSGEAIISIYDKDKFLEINEFNFEEYKWGRDAKAVEEMYIDAMVEYYFRNRYEKTLLVLNSALKVYKKDARVYTRLMECYARLGQDQQALDIMQQAVSELNGFDTDPGISRYRFELEQSIAVASGQAPVKEHGIFGKILRAPAKLWPF